MSGTPLVCGGLPEALRVMEEMTGDAGTPVPLEISSDPFHVLVSTIISLRTRDAVTSVVSSALLRRAPDPASMLALEEDELESLLRPAGFYRQKALQLRKISSILIEDHGSRVPRTMDELLALPGVGRKTANYVMGMVFGEPSICVDVHVHRISNRLGLVSTSTPHETEEALKPLLPLEGWTGINHIMVRFGQNICRPVRPLCDRCMLRGECAFAGVER